MSSLTAECPDKFFEHIVKTARWCIDRHREFNDKDSMREMGFACGRVVGFNLAYDSPAEWSATMEALEKEYEEARHIKPHK